ncbi:uncharacterized protein NPIL_635061 [Nephila pilipes]|uniref:Uncharacterized protein n=1 Tax=Nephila pilipes TaxID=299642 RepID=A0A8X6QQ88_NEPPI|nr:uncharacterized protein NPIL_635061 [Nephila pilipes]
MQFQVSIPLGSTEQLVLRNCWAARVLMELSKVIFNVVVTRRSFLLLFIHSQPRPDLPLLVLPKIVTEDYDAKMVLPDDHVSDRERMRSLSGGAKASSTCSSASSRESSSSSITGRFRRQSGDDAHGKKTNAVFDVFRPRSKSDSKSKRPTFMASLRSSMMSSGGSLSRSTVVRPTSPLATHSTPPAHNHILIEPHRPRSGSDSRGAVSKMFEMLRHRSQSVTSDLKNKTGLGTSIQRFLP